MANKGYSLELDDESDAPKKNYSLEMDEAAPAANPQSENGGEQDPGILQSLAAGARDMIPSGQKISAGLEAGVDKLTGTDKAPLSDIYRRVLVRNDNQLKAAQKYNPGTTTVGQALGFGASLAVPVGGAVGAGIKGLLAAGVTGGLYGAVDAYGRSRASNEYDEAKDTGLGILTGIITGAASHAIGEGVSRGYGALQKALGRGEQGAKQAFVDATNRAAKNAASQSPKASAAFEEVSPKATEESIATANKFGSRPVESEQAIQSHQAGQLSGVQGQAQAVIAAHASGAPVDPELLAMAQKVQARYAPTAKVQGAGEGAYANMQRELSGDRTMIGQPSFDKNEFPNLIPLDEVGGNVVPASGEVTNAAKIGAQSNTPKGLLSRFEGVQGGGDNPIRVQSDGPSAFQPGQVIGGNGLSADRAAKISLDDSGSQELAEALKSDNPNFAFDFGRAQKSEYAPQSNIMGAGLKGLLTGLPFSPFAHGASIPASIAGSVGKEIFTNPASRLKAAKFANQALKSSDPVLKMVGESLKRTVRNESQNKVDEVMKSTDDPRRP